MSMEDGLPPVREQGMSVRETIMGGHMQLLKTFATLVTDDSVNKALETADVQPALEDFSPSCFHEDDTLDCFQFDTLAAYEEACMSEEKRFLTSIKIDNTNEFEI